MSSLLAVYWWSFSSYLGGLQAVFWWLPVSIKVVVWQSPCCLLAVFLRSSGGLQAVFRRFSGSLLVVIRQCSGCLHAVFWKSLAVFRQTSSGILIWHSNKLALLDYPFQYGPVIKLPLRISQCHMVNHMALTNLQRLQFWCNIFTSFLVNLLLDPIGMLIPWLKKSWITNPKLLASTIQNSTFGIVLDCSISR